MFLQDGSLRIRNATADDAALLCGWWNNGRVMTHAGFPEGLGTTAERIKICEESKREKGFGTRFLRMLIAHLFLVLRYRVVILDTNLTNARAQHVYEKLGFRRTAVLIDSWRNQRGELQSQVHYQLTQDDFVSAMDGQT